MNNTVNSSEEGPLTRPFPRLTLLQQSFRAGSVLLVLLLSLFGNIFVLYVVRSNIKLHTVTHYQLVNLACADLLITVVNMSHLFKMEVTGDDQTFGGVAGQVYCIGLMVMLNISVSSSVLTLTAVAVERFYSIMFPFERIIIDIKNCQIHDDWHLDHVLRHHHPRFPSILKWKILTVFSTAWRTGTHLIPLLPLRCSRSCSLYCSTHAHLLSFSCCI